MSQHWYDKTGAMRYDADLKTARKEGLLPSVTTIDKVIANEGLEIWKVNQAIMSALTLPRAIKEATTYDHIMDVDRVVYIEESDTDYIKRIKADSMEQARKAARLGNVLHKLSERFISGKSLFFKGHRQDVWDCFKPVETWIDENIIHGEAYAEQVLVGEGYAGKADYCGWAYDREKGIDYKKILLDYKSTFLTKSDITKKKTIYKSKIYPSWGRQLAALNKVANADIVMSVIISTNPDFTGVWTYEWSADELDRAWVQFESAVKIYRSIKRL